MFDALLKLFKPEPKRDRVEELLEQHDAKKKKANEPDPFFVAVGEHLAKSEAREQWRLLLEHWAAADGAEPTKKWLETTQQHLDALGAETVGERLGVWLPVVNAVSVERSDALLKGAAWTCGLLGLEGLDVEVGAFAQACFKRVPGHGPLSRKLGNAAVWALGRSSTTHGLAQLSRLKTSVKYAEALAMIDKALSAAAARKNLSPAQLEELAVPELPAFEAVGRFWPHVRFEADGSPKLEWMRDDGKVQKSAPKELPPGDVAKVKQQFKRLEELLPAQARRIETFFLSRRAIAFSEWRPRYLEHGLVGLITRKLVWTFAGRAAVCFDGTLIDAKGARVEPAPGDEVRLWHPLDGEEDIEKLVTWAQPFAQVERETFEPFEEERESGHVHRFEGRVVSQQAFHERCRQLGWRYTLQGMWDSHNVPHRVVDGVRAELQANPHGEDTTPAAVYLRLRIGQLVLMGDAPRTTFSEVLREVEQLTKGSN
jgi:hypothetical protein